MSKDDSLFIDGALSPRLVSDLRRLNPWWEDEDMPALPKTRRHLVAQIRRRIDAEIAPIVVVRGPRQIGKTTAQFQMIQDLLNEGVPPTSILRVQFDELESLKKVSEPILAISEWFGRKITKSRFNRLAAESGKAYLFFDESQNLGYDLKARKPHPKDPTTAVSIRFVEVKGRAFKGEIALTQNEYKTAERLKQDYWLYIVFQCATDEPSLNILRDPTPLRWEAITTVERYRLKLEDPANPEVREPGAPYGA